MRDDLLDANAALDWVESDLPNFEHRVSDWLSSSPSQIVRDTESAVGRHLFQLRNVKQIPSIVSAHAGALIHSVRSSLDILAVSLAERNGHPRPEDVYFPITKDEASFKKNALKKIKGLSLTG